MNTSIPQKRCDICKELKDITCFYQQRRNGKRHHCKACEQGKPYVYALSYPESMGGCIFYIGKGVGRRIDKHEEEAKSTRPFHNKQKCIVIWDIWNHSERVGKTKLSYFATDEEALLYEFALIFFLPNLVNVIDGIPPLLLENEERLRLASEVTRYIAEQKEKL